MCVHHVEPVSLITVWSFQLATSTSIVSGGRSNLLWLTTGLELKVILLWTEIVRRFFFISSLDIQ